MGDVYFWSIKATLKLWEPIVSVTSDKFGMFFHIKFSSGKVIFVDRTADLTLVDIFRLSNHDENELVEGQNFRENLKNLDHFYRHSLDKVKSGDRRQEEASLANKLGNFLRAVNHHEGETLNECKLLRTLLENEKQK